MKPSPEGSPFLSGTGRFAEVLAVFLRLGLTSFGGPIAHLGYFRREFVEKRRWLDETAFADLLALCQFLPGPASSQMGMGIGLLRAGIFGAICAWIGFTAPSALVMILFGYGVAHASFAASPWLHGLMLVAVAVVADAVLRMGRVLAPDRTRASVAGAAAALALLAPPSVAQLAAIGLGAAVGFAFCRNAPRPGRSFLTKIGGRWSAAALTLFFGLLMALPVAVFVGAGHTVAVIDRFYRAGALVFGGGHVVLPLLEAAVVPSGWVNEANFLSGYGAAQAVPGPLFTFAAYLGTVMMPAPNGWQGGLICLVAIFLPSFLLILGVLPLWNRLRNVKAQAALAGINAAVVGLLLAALYNPLWTSAVRTSRDVLVALAAFLMLAVWRLPPFLVVMLGAAATALLARFR